MSSQVLTSIPRPMAIMAECRACLVRLVELTVSLATPDPELQSQARDAALAVIEAEFAPGAIPALIASCFHDRIRRLTGNPDPFLAYKRQETAFLSEYFPRVAPAYPPELEALLKLAALGNAVDFFRSRREVTADLTATVRFARSQVAEFRDRLGRKPGLLLYLADNAGEQYFDAPLAGHLRRLGWQVLYVVKGGPVQNDLTRRDLEESGLQGELDPVLDTGAQTVGLDLKNSAPTFQEAYARAGLILAKGMGHFETLSHLAEPRLFFLFQAKCRPVATAAGVDPGEFVFCRGPHNFP